MVKKAALFAGIVLVLGVAVVLYIFNKPHASADDPEFFVTAKELIAEFEQDETAANKKYLGKAVEVSGTIADVMEKQNSFVLLLGDSTSVSRVSCTLQGTQDSMAYGLRKGDKLTLRGVCSGRLLDVVLTECDIVDNDG